MTTAAQNGTGGSQGDAAPTRPRAHARDDNAAQRQFVALDLLSQGYGLQEIITRCGFTSRFAARRALQAARKAIAEDTAEEHRLNFRASYGPVRQALHRKARRGDVRAAEVLVKLDERESRLFGLDLTPDAAMLNVQYTKRIVLETTIEQPAQLPAPSVESEPSA